MPTVRVLIVSTALYRRYRPETFADVIGQEHVTEPLMTALRKDRVNHAYLFSGPRGCGKTTSARILARCLNCAEGPTATPCGHCPSCVELARGGSGSLDVIEIDAASHGGVDDARDLRERATFAPVRDRYKIFIIDEAHMVTSAGFNALLKIVEEPPEHIKFIFATTEPDKVIGTIRSRTHHYPFRLVPPEPLMGYLESLCQQENVPVAPGVLSLVVRAGGGSVRDSLSVLDQLMAGAGEQGLDYELAVSLLGYTHASLLDDVVEAVAAADAATVFGAVDRVIQTGHDPRRFVEDLLERFRDLIIINAMPESAAAVLRGIPADQLARLQTQASQLGAGELSRAADVTNTALTEMTGATSPRLHLELLCARILLPAADQSERGVTARVDRIERRLSYATPADAAPAAPAPVETPRAPEPETAIPSRETPEPSATGTPAAWAPASESPAAPASEVPASSTPAPTAPATPPAVDAAAPQADDTAPEVGAAAPSGGQVEMIRRAWPEIMETLAGIKRATWMVVVNEATPRSFDGSTLELAFKSPGNAIGFNRSNHLDNLSQAINQVLGLQVQINPLHDASAAAGEPAPKAPSRPAPARGTPAEEPRSEIWAPPPSKTPAAPAQEDDSWAMQEPPQEEEYEAQEPPAREREPETEPEPETRRESERAPAPAHTQDQEREQPDSNKPLSRYQRMLNEAAAARAEEPARAGHSSHKVDLAYVEDVPSADDETIEESGLVGRAAIERILNGRLVEERSLDAI